MDQEKIQDKPYHLLQTPQPQTSNLETRKEDTYQHIPYTIPLEHLPLPLFYIFLLLPEYNLYLKQNQYPIT